jgi:RHH-type proline utilization regulon transcriptional repressor/proline dehydrogenase/delta 1-pyrroline-5-carboxylate dehydrogenase
MRYASVDVEQRTQEIGRELFRRVRDTPIAFSLNRWLDERFMRIAMRNETRRTQLFRLVDTLPMLSSARQVGRHLQEYLGVPEWIGTPAAQLTEWGVRRMARGFIAATDFAEARQAVAQLRTRGLGFTIDVLGEAVVSEVEAEGYAQLYRQLVEELTGDDVNVSVKLSSLDSQFDPVDPTGTSRRVRSRLRPILRAAMERGAFINIDMEQHAYKDVTLRIFREVLEEQEFRNWNNVGIAIQAYLRDDDLPALVAWGRPVWVRLVKGAYWDYETVIAAQNNWPDPVFLRKSETDANFERLTTLLLESDLRPAIATHNIRSIAHALAESERRKRPVEFQMLYGMADPIKMALVGMGHKVRVYTPFGQLLPGMAYLVRRLLENTSNESFLRAGFLEHIPEDQLLMKPDTQSPVGHTPRSAARHDNEFFNEPVADFSREEARAAMQRALAKLDLGQTYPLVLGGRRFTTGQFIESVNPSHNSQLVGRVACAGPEHAREAVAAAKAAGIAVGGRVELVRKLASVLRHRRYELAAWEVVECAKQWREADADVCEAIDFCEFYAAEMARLSAPRRRDVPGESNEYFYEPRGVVVVIAPWNFPLAILTGMTAAAVVTGNAAIMKPAEPSPVIAAKLMEMFEQAGAPPGVVNYLPGHGSEIGPVLVRHPDVAMIAFTGSLEVGGWINRAAAESFKHVVCEMGGKNAIIIDEDADLDEAIKGVIASAFGYAGQKCSACSRVIVLDSIYDAFLKRLMEAARSLKVGPAEDPGNFVGPVIDAKARERILAMIQGERPVFVGEEPDGGYYVAPRIYADVGPDSKLAQEEIFGPILAVLRARSLDAALQIATGVKYALTGGFYSRSPANIERVRRQFRVGNLYINRKITGAVVDRQPFGGFKMSGLGAKAGGPDYLPQFMVARTVTENTMRRGFAPSPG